MSSLLDQVVKTIEKELEPPKKTKVKLGSDPIKERNVLKTGPQEGSKITLPAYCKAIFLSSVVGDEFPKESYTAAIQSLLKNIDLIALHKQLIDEKLLTRPNISQILAELNSSELKELLKQKGLKTTGTKEELIETIISGLKADEIMQLSKRSHIFVLSAKGEKYISRYCDYIYMFKRKTRYGIDIEEYYNISKLNSDLGTFEIAKLIIKEHTKAAKYSNLSLAEVELDKAALYEDEMKETGKNKNKEIINAKMKYIYYSLNYSRTIENLIKAMENNQQIQMPKPEKNNYFTNNALKILSENSADYIHYDLNNLPGENTLKYCICPRELIGKILSAFFKNPNTDYEKFNRPINELERDWIMNRLANPKSKK